MPEEDDRTPEELEEDLGAELQERIRLAITGKTYTLEEVLERSKQRRTELSALTQNSDPKA
jgi:hypothetical protein